MARIGGNIKAILQVKDDGWKNVIGEREHSWFPAVELTGWLDYMGGDSKYTSYSAKIQESTHVFLADFQSFICLSAKWQWNPFNFLTSIINTELDEDIDVTSENARLLIDQKIYDIMLIDDPMNLHQHLEIYLKYVGGQDG